MITGFSLLIYLVVSLLLNDEAIYLHTPEITHFGKFNKLMENQLSEIDNLATLMLKPYDNFTKLQKIWNTKKKFRLLKG